MHTYIQMFTYMYIMCVVVGGTAAAATCSPPSCSFRC